MQIGLRKDDVNTNIPRTTHPSFLVRWRFFQSNGLMDLCVGCPKKSFESLDDYAVDEEEQTDLTTTRLSLVCLESASWMFVEQNDTLKRPKHSSTSTELLNSANPHSTQ